VILWVVLTRYRVLEIWHIHMKVFISWSGENSHKVATALHDWLPYIIQAVKPFISSGDILKGERWTDVLANELEDTRFGIICLTSSNIESPWLHFEAGALSKSIDRSSLSPFLFQVKPSDVEGPLAMFQSTVFEKEDIFNLLTSINQRLEPPRRLDITLLRHTFETWWPQLEWALRQATQKHESATGYDWLYHPSDILPLQLSTNCKSIWVVVPLMRHALQTTCEREVVERNIDRGIKYRFIFARSGPGETHAARDSLWRSFEERSAEKEIFEICPDEYLR
jgi:TIR domain